MAIYSIGSGASRIAGSRRGSTFQKTANGFIIRKRTVPVQKRTNLQSISKNRLESTSQRWKNLTGAQQATWIAEAPNYPRTNSLGNSYTVQPSALSIGTSINAIQSNDTPIDILPSPVPFPSRSVEDVGFSDSISFLEMRLETTSGPPDSTVPLNFNAKIFFTAALSPGQGQPPDFAYKLIAILPEATDTAGYNFYTEYLTKLPPLSNANGLKIFAAVKFTSLDNYQDSPFIFSFGQVI